MPSNNNQELDDDTRSIISNIDLIEQKDNLEELDTVSGGYKKGYIKSNPKNKKYVLLQPRTNDDNLWYPFLTHLFAYFYAEIFSKNNITAKCYPSSSNENDKIFDDEYAYKEKFVDYEFIYKYIQASDKQEDQLPDEFIALDIAY